MCLTTIMKTPFTAKKDFVVCKVLTKIDDRGFITPCQEVAIDLNDTLKPLTKFPEVSEIDDITQTAKIEGGAIHAYIMSLSEMNRNMYYGNSSFKAIVHEGTRFYVSTDGTEIAAEKMYITDEKSTEAEIAETQEYIMTELIATAEQYNGVRVGDILLSDKTFVHVEDYNDDSMTAIGIVGYFIDGKPISIGLKTKELQWELDRANLDHGTINKISSELEAYDDYNGRKYTDKLYAVYKDRLDDFPALKYCVEYETKGTKKGDWYFPSSGEVANIARNLAVINYSLDKIDSTMRINVDERIWSSAEYFVGSAWPCHMGVVHLYYYYAKWTWVYVRPVISI